MADPNESGSDNFGDLKVEDGGVGLDGDAAGAAMGADLDGDASGGAETQALDEESDQADVTASGAE